MKKAPNKATTSKTTARTRATVRSTSRTKTGVRAGAAARNIARQTTTVKKAARLPLADEMLRLISAVKAGQLQERGHVELFEGTDRTLLSGINEMIEIFVKQLRFTGHYVEQIGKGNLPEKISEVFPGEFNQVRNNLNFCLDSISGVIETARTLDKLAAGESKVRVKAELQGEYRILVNSTNALGEQIELLGLEMLRLSEAAGIGNLDFRGNTAQFKGDIAAIVQGVNETMTGIVTPLRDIGSALDRLAAGDTSALVTADYKGDYNVLKVAANELSQQLHTLIVEDAGLALNSAAARDLTKRVEKTYKGDFEKMKLNINLVLQSLDESLGQVVTAAEQVTAAATQISVGSQLQAQGASEQASSLEEVSSGLQEMSSMTRQNAASAKEARSLSDGARGAAERGMDNMQKLSSAIDLIKKSSAATAKIIKTIDEIAFQTNLLALNAAVEAARAGDAGKGFAVVAEEVRNLAMRSAEAAKNTANMIEESVRNSENGVSLNELVSGDLKDISDQVRKVSEVMGEIAVASEQQKQGVDQINTAIDQVNSVTQQAAASSEESATASEELSGQAEELLSMVSSFQLTSVIGRTHGKAAVRAAATPGKSGGGKTPPAAKAAPARPQLRPGHAPKPSFNNQAERIIPFTDDHDRSVMEDF